LITNHHRGQSSLQHRQHLAIGGRSVGKSPANWYSVGKEEIQELKMVQWAVEEIVWVVSGV
jgi:hypothetical protein